MSDATAQRSHEICRIWDTTLIMTLKYLMREPDTCVRVRNEKIDINETNWTPNQYTEYLNLYIKTAKRAALNP